jgi:phosphatidylserine/phosphatidylglycerophosphate/cardiolipin synthase-like enzyme
MTRFLFGDLLWKTISNRAKQAHRTKAAIAYVTRELPLSFKPDDVLIVDASDDAISSGQTSAVVLARLMKSGVCLYSHDGLHAKIIVVDSTLFASSANLSDSSLSRLLEAGIETDNPNAVSAAVGSIERLMSKSLPIDPGFVARIKKIVVEKRRGIGKSKARATPKDYREPVTWLMGVHDIDMPKNPEELKRIEAGTAKAEQFLSTPKSSSSWIRLGRKAEAQQGDNLIMIRRQSTEASPKRVYRHSPVLLVEDEPKCKRLYYEEAPNAEKQSLSWGQFKKLAKLAGLPPNISKNTSRKLSGKVSANLHDYWEEVR